MIGTYRCGHKAWFWKPEPTNLRSLCLVCQHCVLCPEEHTLVGYMGEVQPTFQNDEDLRQSHEVETREGLSWAIDDAVRKERDGFATTPDVLFYATVLRSYSSGVYVLPSDPRYRDVWGERRQPRTEDERLAWAEAQRGKR